MEQPSGRETACMLVQALSIVPLRAPPLPAAPTTPPAADDNGEVVPQDLFTKRQLLRMGAIDPDRTKHFLPRLSRAELGSYADDYVAEEFDVEVRPAATCGHGWLGGGLSACVLAGLAVVLLHGLLLLVERPASCFTLIIELDVPQADLYPEVPENVPLYNLRAVVPEIYEPR